MILIQYDGKQIIKYNFQTVLERDYVVFHDYVQQDG